MIFRLDRPIGYVALLLVSFLFITIAQAGGYDSGDLKTGALLYDKWMAISGKKPSGNHPLYPSSSKKKGEATWRCKECHGWDYIGKDGRYSKGSHFTGIMGLTAAKGKSPDDLYKAITTGKHDYSKYLSKKELWSLVKFVKEGMFDVTASLNSDGSVKGGNKGKGKTHYSKSCESCHGGDGNKIDVKATKDGVQGVGWLAKDNPQESLHKYRWGHPGSMMPSGIVDKKMSNKDIADTLAYGKTLP